jgi:hypothetical protein
MLSILRPEVILRARCTAEYPHLGPSWADHSRKVVWAHNVETLKLLPRIGALPTSAMPDEEPAFDFAATDSAQSATPTAIPPAPHHPPNPQNPKHHHPTSPTPYPAPAPASAPTTSSAASPVSAGLCKKPPATSGRKPATSL